MRLGLARLPPGSLVAPAKDEPESPAEEESADEELPPEEMAGAQAAPSASKSAMTRP
jgi:hypothetical protein